MSAPVMIMAGGTGGHVFPALSVAEELRRRDVPVVWLGTPEGIEARVVPAAGIALEWMTVGGLRGKGLASWLGAPVRLVRAVLQARRAFRRHRPRAALGMGGFASGPGGVAARLTGTPLVIHEQNAVAGLTNRCLRRIADEVLCGFEGAFGSHQAVRVVGNPVRPELFRLPSPQQRHAAAANGVLNLLVLGGSQGAWSLNRVVPEALARLPEGLRPRVRHQAGARTLAAAREAYARTGVDAEVCEFIDDMAGAYGWAHLVVCRSGALTVSELAAAGCAAVLVPYPLAVDDHQSANGRALVEAGAAEMIADRALTPASLGDCLQRLLGAPARLLEMAEAARRHGAPDAARKVADALLAPREAA